MSHLGKCSFLLGATNDVNSFFALCFIFIAYVTLYGFHVTHICLKKKKNRKITVHYHVWFLFYCDQKNYQYWDLTILNLSTQMRLFCEARKIHCKLVSESAVLISLSIHIFSILLASFSPRSIRLNYWCIIETIRFQYFGWKRNYIIRKLKFKALSKSFYGNVGFVLLGNLFYVFK